MCIRDRVDKCDREKQTPLHCAAAAGQREIIRLLVAAGAGVNAYDRDKRTPLHRHLASTRRSKEVLEILLKGGADPNAKDRSGKTVLQEAARNGERDVLVQTLQRYGAKS